METIKQRLLLSVVLLLNGCVVADMDSSGFTVVTDALTHPAP